MGTTHVIAPCRNAGATARIDNRQCLGVSQAEVPPEIVPVNTDAGDD